MLNVSPKFHRERSIEWIRIEIEAIPDGLDAIVHKITDLLVSETENDLSLSQVSSGGVISVVNVIHEYL